MATSDIAYAPIAPVVVPRLRTTLAWTLAGNTIYALCQWGMISSLAKLGTTSEVGQFALALAITAPVYMLTNLSLRSVQATDARSEFTFSAYFTLRSIGAGVGLLTVAVIVFVMGHDWRTSAIIMVIGLAKAVESFSDVTFGLLQKHERLDQVAISVMLKGICSLAAFCAVYIWLRSVVLACTALFVMWLLVFLLYDRRLARNIEGNAPFVAHESRPLLALAKLAAPIGVVMAMTSLNANIPRYAIQHYRGSGELGIFAALAYLIVAVGLVVNALGQSVVARLSRDFAAGNVKQFIRILKHMCLLGICLGGTGIVAAALCGRTVLRIIYGAVYANHLYLLILLIGASGITAVGSFLGYGMTAARRFRAQVPVTAATMATCAGLVLVFTPRWGMTGAALAMLFAGMVQIVGSLIVLSGALRQSNAEPISARPALEPILGD